MLRLLPLGLLALVLAACGGGGSDGSGNPVADAATETVNQGTELSTTSGSVTDPEQSFALAANGGWNHSTAEGYQHVTLTVDTTRRELDEVFIGHVFWIKSDLLDSILPTGKTWLKVDTTTAKSDFGFNFKGLMAQTSADVLKQLERTAEPVKTIGKETVGGVETTHYRATLDPKQLPSDRFAKLTKTVVKPVDVWVDGDDLVRQVKLDYTTKAYTNEAMRAHIQLTMKLSDFGATVDVEPPPAASVVDASSTVP